MVTSVVMITMYTGVEVNKDIEKGVFDRFRTLPIWRPSTMVGYLLGDMLRYIMASVVILCVGLVMGFRPEGGFVGGDRRDRAAAGLLVRVLVGVDDVRAAAAQREVGDGGSACWCCSRSRSSATCTWTRRRCRAGCSPS
ncbi:ABC transporter permease [Nonomuraea ferruginea]